MGRNMAGTVDRIDNFGLAGWACTDDGAKACRMRVDVNGTPAYVFIPTDFRPDLAKAGWAHGYCSVEAGFPKILGLFEPASVEVWNEETNTLLTKKGLMIEAAIKRSGRYKFMEPTNVASTCPVVVTYEGDVCVVHGIAVYPSNRELEPTLISGDASVVSFKQQIDAPKAFPQSCLTQRSFVLRTRSRESSPFSLFRIAPADFDAGGKDFAGYVAMPARAPESAEVPPHENMSRVSGQAVTPSIFAAAGLTTAAKLDGAARHVAGKPLRDFNRILDWGSGIGRVARPLQMYFAPQSEIWCADIDRVNIDKAATFLPHARHMRIPYYPPTEFPSDYFDFIYGISVFTHLTEDAQEVWLAELRRLSRRGTILIMSVNTEFAAIELATGNAGSMTDLLVLGISDRLRDGNLGSKLDHSNYYRSTYHLTEYVKEQWGKYFEILGIINRADTHVQDFVVMRKS
jgi:hypothetical protein